MFGTMNDRYIIDGFRSFDPYITKEYFYGYCQRAYKVYDHKYQLRDKVGMDFYSLAHEYYIHLLQHEFKPLLDKPTDTKLSTWMIRGFHFVVLDALKAYNKEFKHQADEISDVVLEYVRSDNSDEKMLYYVAEAVADHYQDRVMQEIAHMVIYAGFTQKEVAEKLGMTPSAVNQRYKKMMEEVITPFVIENYGMGIGVCSYCLDQEFAAPMVMAESIVIPKSNELKSILPTISNMDNNRITPAFVTTLNPDEVFVFGSNLQGIHAGGAARMARIHFGAEMGNGVGIQGQSYAIPTMQGGVETIRPYVDEFIKYAAEHSEKKFLVTPIGCGIAGFEPEDIAPLFAAAKDIENISLPNDFWNIL